MSAEKTALKIAYEILNTQDDTLDDTELFGRLFNWTLITERGQWT